MVAEAPSLERDQVLVGEIFALLTCLTRATRRRPANSEPDAQPAFGPAEGDRWP